MAFYNAALTEEALTHQKELLINTICPFVPDSNGCSSGVTAWWDQVAAALFTEDEAARVCQVLDGSCSLEKAWDCDACKFELFRVGGVYSNPLSLLEISEAMSGPLFCTSPDLALDAGQVTFCQEMMRTFLPAALTAIFSEVAVTLDFHCNDVFGLC